MNKQQVISEEQIPNIRSKKEWEGESLLLRI